MTERELLGVLHTLFDRSDLLIRLFFLFAFSETENMHLSEKKFFQGIHHDFSILGDAEKFFS